MSRTSPTLQTRRVPWQQRIIDSSDEENNHSEAQKDEISDDFGCGTALLMSSCNVQSISSPAHAELDPSQQTSDCQSLRSQESNIASNSILESIASSKAASRPPHRNVRASRRGNSLNPAELLITIPTAQPLETQETQEALASPGNLKCPLSDITNIAVNETPQTSMTKPEPSCAAAPAERPTYEKPMDIVIRTRAKPTTTMPEYTEPKSRLVITYLVLTNFKSYAGRQQVGPFHASFSSVVGPNGSGKSNVIDSLLFVFGFRASKMRQGKISALIHNSAAFPNLAFCEVEVHFQEIIDRTRGQHEVVPDSTLIISRKAFQNNSSKYYINGSESNFTLVTNLLRVRGIDLDHKRFLILQGEVESIAQMKPKAPTEHDDGLLEYLEDIIGTSKYKTPIEDSAIETERLNEVCIEKASRVSHVENEKKSLEGKKDTALAYIKDENELAIKQSALYQIFVIECDDNIQVAQESVAQMQARIDHESEKYRDSEQEIEVMKKESMAEAKQFERIEQNMQMLLKQIAKADKETVKFEEKEKHLQSKMKKLEKTVSSSRFGASEAASCIDRLTDDLKRNSDVLIDIEQRLQAEERQLGSIRHSLKGKTQGLSDEIGKKQKLLEPWTEQINEKRAAIAVAQSQLGILKEREEAGGMALAEAKERLERLEDEKSGKTSDLAEYEAQVISIEEESRHLRASLAKLSAAEPDQRGRLSAARQRADEARASLSKSQTQGNVLAGLKRLKDSGRIKGFHGRLGDLGAIDAKYDIAISTACPALDNLVVDSVEVGQQCIDYLRKNNLGRANFILLNRLDQRNLDPIETPESTSRLFDLVQSKDDIFKPAFFSVLQNTLVAEDLSQANRIAYGVKRWRVVTVDGQLIDKSGTMTGGGTRIAKGIMSSKLEDEISKEQVLALEAEKEEMERVITKLQHEQQAIETSLKSMDDSLPTCVTKVQKCSLEIESLDRNISDATKRLAELSTKTEITREDEIQTKSLEETILRAEKEIEELGSSAGGIQAELQALQDKIMEVGGVKLRSQKAKVDGLSEQMKALMEEMSSAEVSRAKSEKQKVKHEKSISEAEQDLQALAVELQRVKNEAKQQTQDATESKKEAEETQEVLDIKREALEALKTAVKDRTAEINEAKGVELEMRNQLEEHQKTLVENDKRLKYWQEKLKKLRMRDLSDFSEELRQCEFVTYTRDELVDFDKDVIKGEIAILEEKTANANVELGVLSEYRRRVEEHAARSGDLKEAIDARDTAKRRCEELRRLRLEGFMEGFSAISLRLKEMYQMITMGGNAELELVDSLDPFSEGILFSVMPPKKSWKNISNLSGGEKTLSSLALVFALHHYKPTPLYVMDEIDAALDFRNVSIVASYIKERTKNAQFIVISLRNNMFELASRLVGVYKVNHMTKSVTVENRDYIARAS